MVFITGASGNVGKELINFFIANKQSCIAASRRNIWNSSHVEHRKFDFTDPSTFDTLKGVDTVFLVRPPELSNVKKVFIPFFSKCKEYGVKKIIFLSVIGVEQLSFIPHYKIEKAITAFGFDYCFIRAGFFMQNISTTHALEIKERNEIVVPCGKGKTTFVHVRDIAEIGYKILNKEILVSKIDVAGNDTLDYYEIASRLSALLNRKITYKNSSIPSFVVYRLRHGTPIKFALVMVGIYLPTKLGKAEIKGIDIEPLLGHAPVSFDQFLQEEKSTWAV